MHPIPIQKRFIGPGFPCFVIAEAGVNHNGQVDMALRLVDAAAQAGVDAVKFQSFQAKRLVSRGAPKAPYQLHTTDAQESQFAMLQRLELDRKAHERIIQHCKDRNVTFLSTPFDEPSADLLDELGIPLFKIPSGEVTNWLLLEHIAKRNKPVILSTGMSFLGEVDDAVRVLNDAGCHQIVLLHCLTDYPAQPSQTNLRAMQTMSAAMKLPVGYSDHTPGMEVTLAAVALGACLIEKHMTLDRTLPGPDQAASLEPQEMAALVRGVRMVEGALGDGRKTPAPSELANRQVVRRSLAAKRRIAEGDLIDRDSLCAMRPGTAIATSQVGLVVGRRARRAIEEGTLIVWSDLA